MKARMAWVVGRTVGLGILAVFATAQRVERIAAACKICSTICVPQKDGSIKCNPATCGDINDRGNSSCQQLSTGGCYMSGMCSS
jgi:hypothetical protein